MNKKEIKRLDAIWSEKVKEDAGNKCELTGEKNCRLNSHHYIGRKNRSTRWYLPCGVCLSASKHTLSTWSAHQNPEWFRKEMLDIRGDIWLKDLITQSNKTFKGSYQKVLDYLNRKTNNYV